jgi:hypothetical protein
MARPEKKIVLLPTSACPCGSGKSMASCHLDWDGKLRIPRRSLDPPGAITGRSLAACYLRGTRNCSARISREHYISRSVLEQLGVTIAVSGMPWQRDGEIFSTSIASLIAKILCERHNHALSPLDTEAGKFFSNLTSALVDLERKTLSRRPIFHLISGEMIELWMLKVACGLYYSVGAVGGRRLEREFSIDESKIINAFFQNIWDHRAGIYFLGTKGDQIRPSNSVGFAPLYDQRTNLFSGAKLFLRGFGFDLVFDSSRTNAGEWTGLVRRPSELTLERRGRKHILVLSWPPGAPDAGVVCSTTPPRP